MSKPVKIRCPGNRPHLVKGTKYHECGSLLFAINEEEIQDAHVQCRVCKKWWHVMCDGEGNVEVIEDGKDLEFKNQGGENVE